LLFSAVPGLNRIDLFLHPLDTKSLVKRLRIQLVALHNALIPLEELLKIDLTRLIEIDFPPVVFEPFLRHVFLVLAPQQFLEDLLELFPVNQSGAVRIILDEFLPQGVLLLNRNVQHPLLLPHFELVLAEHVFLIEYLSQPVELGTMLLADVLQTLGGLPGFVVLSNKLNLVNGDVQPMVVPREKQFPEPLLLVAAPLTVLDFLVLLHVLPLLDQELGV